MRVKIGKDFHPACVDALERALDARGEVYGEGHEEAVEYAVPPPVAALGSTLDDQAAAAAAAKQATTTKAAPPPEPPTPAPEPKKKPAPAISRDAALVGALVAIALGAGIVGATASTAANLAVPVAFAALVAAGEIVCLRPLGRAPRPLSLVAALVALHALTLPVAAIAIGAGELVALACNGRVRLFAQRTTIAATMLGAYAALSGHWPGTTSTAATLTTLVGSCTAALVVAELLDRHGRMRLDVRNRLADLALLASAPLVALGTVGTTARAGLGLGAFPVLIVPLALLTHGFLRTQRAHENLFAWVRAVAVAPEHATLVPRGHADRVVRHARRLAEQSDLDAPTQEQLEAAAWMERVGECCLDDGRATGQPHEPADVADASAAILESCRAFDPAVRILRTTFRPSDGETAIDRAAHILREAIARAETDEETPVEPMLLAPAIGADARTSDALDLHNRRN